MASNRSRRSRNGAKAKERTERRGDRDRRKSVRATRRDRLDARDLYKTDLDRHLWAWPKPKSARRKKKKAGKTSDGRRRRVARLVASAAGMLGAAGVSYLVYRRLRKRDGDFRDDPEAAQADGDLADESEEV
ncbi:MAG: hypothetical protein V3U63_01850 [Gemmatimonadota bacterium]|nr:hypothetical protein [Candidatus Palauibacterales bacterium]